MDIQRYLRITVVKPCYILYTSQKPQLFNKKAAHLSTYTSTFVFQVHESCCFTFVFLLVLLFMSLYCISCLQKYYGCDSNKLMLNITASSIAQWQSVMYKDIKQQTSLFFPTKLNHTRIHIVVHPFIKSPPSNCPYQQV